MRSSAALGLPFEKIAQDFAAQHGLADKSPESIAYEDVIAKNFAQLKLGAFDVRFPSADLDTHGEDFRACAAAMLSSQEKFVDWLALAPENQKSLHEDVKVLSAWVKSWKVPALAKGKTQPGVDVFTLLQAPDAIAQASQHLFDALAKGAAFGPARDSALAVRIVLMPTRKEFCEFVIFSGWIMGDQRGLFWLENVPDWTQCFVVNDQVIALEYGIVARPPTDYTSGTAMSEILQQQVAQLSMNSLLLAHYGERAPGAFISGLSMNLVLDTFGMVQTRVDGDTRSKVTAKREVFVPGGASQGGVLGKNSAETKWRENGGKDHFLPTLRAAQEEGEKLNKGAKNKVACFSMRSDRGGEKWAAIGPFFGAAAANATAPPPEFQGDFAEFLRAYKSAFIYWLQTKSQGGEKASREKFGTLLKKLADPNLVGDFEGVFKDVFDGAALSGPELDKETLEGKFLLWLAKQK